MKAFLLLGEIAFLGGMTIVYKSSIDLLLYVVGSSSENEVRSESRRPGDKGGSVLGWRWALDAPVAILPLGSGGGRAARMGFLQLYYTSIMVLRSLGDQKWIIAPSVVSC